MLNNFDVFFPGIGAFFEQMLSGYETACSVSVIVTFLIFDMAMAFKATL